MGGIVLGCYKDLTAVKEVASASLYLELQCAKGYIPFL